MKYSFILISLAIFAFVRILLACNFAVVQCQLAYKTSAKNTLGGYNGVENKKNPTTFGDLIGLWIQLVREKFTRKVRSYFPSPHSELLLGMLLGIDDLKMIPRFNDVLKSTGTIHVVVVSGYNISLVFEIVIQFIGSKYKLRNLLTAQFVTFLYAVISGFQPPVIRSWIMGSIASWGRFYGRSVEAAQILVFSALVMLAVNPMYLFSLSFQLSFLATLGLILYSDTVQHFFKYKNVLIDDLASTISAQILVWPLISHVFGRISLVSPFVNALILWTVPVATVTGMIFLPLSLVSSLLSEVFMWVVFVPLDIFIRTTKFFALFKFSYINHTVSAGFMFFYYLIVLTLPYLLKKFKKPLQT